MDREERLDCHVKRLYHQTSKQNADSILKSGRMLPGTSGLAGGGIYFATTPEHTDHKATNRGVVLEADVRLGRVKAVSSHGDLFVTYERLQKDGYDSVLIARANGAEYVVYNPDQVGHIRVHAVRKQNVHQYSFNTNGRFAHYRPTGHVNF